MSEEIITAKGITVRYNSIDVLNDVSFVINPGDYVGLVGPNGSGKSTLVKTILGFLKPATGSIYLFGCEPRHLKKWDKIGYLPQKMSFFNPNFPSTVEEIVTLGLLSKKGFPKRINSTDKDVIDKALELLNIKDIRTKLIGDLSRGQQQRVLAARTIVNEPELLILDEPTTALDPEMRENFFSMMSEFNSAKKTTIILVTHDIGGIGKYALKLMYLDKRIIFYGSFENFCKSEKMTAYFGASSQHIICHKHN